MRRAGLLGGIAALIAIALAACGSSGPSAEDEAFLEEDLPPLGEKCPRALAEYAADEFTEGLIESGKSPAYVKCLHGEIEGFLLLTGIVPELLLKDPGFAPVAALEGIVEGAKRNCT